MRRYERIDAIFIKLNIYFALDKHEKTTEQIKNLILIVVCVLFAFSFLSRAQKQRA